MVSIQSEPTEDPTWRARKRRTFAICSLNCVAMMLVAFLAILMIRDRETYILAVACISAALGSSYLSIRVRFNLVGLLLLLAVAAFYAFLLQFYLQKTA